jgi:hypothetical protein
VLLSNAGASHSIFYLSSIKNNVRETNKRRCGASSSEASRTTERSKRHISIFWFFREKEKEVGMDRIISLPPPTPDTLPGQGHFSPLRKVVIEKREKGGM